MRRLPLLLVPALIAVVVSCSNPTTTPVGPADSQKAITAMSDVESAGFATASGACTPTITATTVSATCPYFTVYIVFTPSLAAFSGAGAASAVETLTITNYPDATTGYTISGSVTCTINVNAMAFTSLVYSANLTFSGSGPVKTMTANATFNYTTLAYTGTVTVNGQTFTY